MSRSLGANRSPLFVGRVMVTELTPQARSLALLLIEQGLTNKRVTKILQGQKHLAEREYVPPAIYSALRAEVFPQTNTRKRPMLTPESYQVGMAGVNAMVNHMVELMEAAVAELYDGEKLRTAGNVQKFNAAKSLLALATQRLLEIMKPDSDLIGNYLDVEMLRIEKVKSSDEYSAEDKARLIREIQDQMIANVMQVAAAIRDGKEVPDFNDLSPKIRRFLVNPRGEKDDE